MGDIDGRYRLIILNKRKQIPNIAATWRAVSASSSSDLKSKAEFELLLCAYNSRVEAIHPRKKWTHFRRDLMPTHLEHQLLGPYLSFVNSTTYSR